MVSSWFVDMCDKKAFERNVVHSMRHCLAVYTYDTGV
jgi:hypothetical protein